MFQNLKSYKSRLLYFLKFRNAYKELPPILDNFATIEELLNSKKSLIRFGDGEFTYMEGIDLAFQKYEKSLGDKLKEIFYKDVKDLLIGTIGLYYYLPKGLYPKHYNYTYRFLNKYRECMPKYYNPSKTYYSSFISIVCALFKKYSFEEHYNKIRKIWDKQKVTIITGDRVFENIEHNIFDNAQNLNYVFAPTINAYDEIDTIRKKISTIDKDEILIFALGPCGKLLAYEAHLQGYRALDLGHIIKDYDLYCNTRVYKKKNFKKELKSFFSPD